MFVVYALYSKTFDKIYIGFTSNMEERFKSHNELAKKGWTIKFRPWQIIHQESFSSKAEVMKREKEFKDNNGKKIYQVIDKLNAML